MNLLGARLPEVIGLTILHSLWQITLLWIILVAVLRLSPKTSSRVRYALAISTLILAVFATAGTAFYEWQSHGISEEVAAISNGIGRPMQTVLVTVEETMSYGIGDALNAALPIVTWLWCAGLLVMGARFSGSFIYLRTLRAPENITAISPILEQKLKRLSRGLGLRCEVAIAASARISSPITLGSISPIILLPAGLLSGLSTAQVEAILVHELYHIKRQDYIINICQALIEVVLFYHPAIWRINNIIREERENCCDDQTVAFCGDAIAYARALTQIKEINMLTKPTLAMSATGPNAGNFTNRIKRLFHIYPDPAQARSKAILAIGFLILYLSILLAGANASIAHAVELETNSQRTVVNNYTLNEVSSDTLPVQGRVSIPDRKEATSQPVEPEKFRARHIHRADTAVSEQSLEKCLRQVRLILNMASYRLPGERFKITEGDSLRIAGPADYLAKTNLKFRQTGFARSVNLSRIGELDLIDGTGKEKAEDMLPEKINRAAVDSMIYVGDESKGVVDVGSTPVKYIEDYVKGAAVQIFPNSTKGGLNINFTPVRDNSRVKIVLVDSEGKAVKQIADSTYDNTRIDLHVDVSGYKKGIYILQINIDGAKSQHRVVID